MFEFSYFMSITQKIKHGKRNVRLSGKFIFHRRIISNLTAQQPGSLKCFLLHLLACLINKMNIKHI